MEPVVCWEMFNNELDGRKAQRRHLWCLIVCDVIIRLRAISVTALEAESERDGSSSTPLFSISAIQIKWI